MKLGKKNDCSQRTVKELKDISAQLLTALDMVSSPSELEIYDELATLHWGILEESNYYAMDELEHRYWVKRKGLEYE